MRSGQTGASVRNRLLRIGRLVLLVAACSGVVGCSYMCHVYQPFSIEAAQGGWQIRGEVDRLTREDISPPPGSVCHWRPDARDRWRVELTPVSVDTAYWRTGDVVLSELTVMTGTDTISVAWKDRIDLVAEAREYTYADGTSRVHDLEFGKYKFTSEFFHLPVEAPAILVVRCCMILSDLATGEERARHSLEMSAVLDRHRRWAIADAAEM